jgi:phosphomannomutase
MGRRPYSYIKAYDIRALIPDELDEPEMERIGAAFVAVMSAERVLVGRDMRVTSPALASAFSAGARSQGADVIDIGLVSVDMLYYASGAMSLPGAMITASHNPAVYNGVKFCRAQAGPFGQDSGLGGLRNVLAQGVPSPGGAPGCTYHVDVSAGFGRHLREVAPEMGSRPLKAVFDAGNGMAGLSVPAALDPDFRAAHQLDWDQLFFELDGTFPHHEANPLVPENVQTLCARVVETGADVGFAFDGDADRCFVVDERGMPVSASTLMAWLGSLCLDARPGAVIATNAIASHAVREAVIAKQGRVVRGPAGHSFMKGLMAREHAVFGGEHAGHYYFSEFWNADSGVLAALHVLAGMSRHDQPLSHILEPYRAYFPSGEISIEGSDGNVVLPKVQAHYGDRPADHVDGLSVYFADGSWFNLRPSNTEPVLRLNVESRSPQRTQRLVEEVLGLVHT